MIVFVEVAWNGELPRLWLMLGASNGDGYGAADGAFRILVTEELRLSFTNFHAPAGLTYRSRRRERDGNGYIPIINFEDIPYEYVCSI